LGGVSEGEFDDKPPFYKRFIEGQGWSDPDGRQFAEEFNVPDTRLYDFFSAPEAIRAYIGMCNMVDDYVGGLLTYLEQSGRLDNTLVIYTADHGDMLGRHGMWYKGLPAYDDQQRIPALAMWRAGAARGGVSRRETSSYSGSANGATARRAPPAAAANHTRSHFSLVDILPTALDAAGLDPVPYVQGVSQLPVITGRAESVRDWALVDHVASTRIRQQTFVHDEWKLVCYNHADYGELYNLAVDPDQMENLWNDPSAGDRKSAMLLRLAQASMDTVGVLPRRINHA
jgi:arylsulfatase A-like enzyme